MMSPWQFGDFQVLRHPLSSGQLLEHQWLPQHGSEKIAAKEAAGWIAALLPALQ
jgi:hypothetical protein